MLFLEGEWSRCWARKVFESVRAQKDFLGDREFCGAKDSSAIKISAGRERFLGDQDFCGRNRLPR